jgi:hypothetical protein
LALLHRSLASSCCLEQGAEEDAAALGGLQHSLLLLLLLLLLCACLGAHCVQGDGHSLQLPELQLGEKLTSS